MRLSNGVAAAFLAVATIGCGLTASPTDGLQFQPPSGWESSPGIMGFMQFWKSPSNDREVLMLFRSPKPLKPSDVFSDARLNDTLKGATIESRSNIEICGHQPATYFRARGSSSRGGEELVEIVITSLRGAGYLAMYVRPLNAPGNPSALAALREVCAKS
jgi:hypothetical protein